MRLPGSGTIFWTEPYRFKTVDKPGITASVRWQAKGDSRVITVAALDILLDDLYRFLSGFQVTTGSRVLLIRNDGTVMLARDADRNQKSGHAQNVSFVPPAHLGKGLIRDAMAVWRNIQIDAENQPETRI